jgi:hypothetical protein
LEALREKSPELAAAVEEFGAAAGDPEAQKKAALKARQTFFRRGAAQRKEETFGGAGKGGAEESRIDKQIGTIEKVAASLTGDAEKDFAKTVPLFAKAAAQMSEAAKNLKQTAEVTALNNKMNPPR